MFFHDEAHHTTHHKIEHDHHSLRSYHSKKSTLIFFRKYKDLPGINIDIQPPLNFRTMALLFCCTIVVPEQNAVTFTHTYVHLSDLRDKCARPF